MSAVRHITYASPNYSRAARELRSSAARFGLQTFVYTTDHPVIEALRRMYPDIMLQKRGGGYWLWKPAIILDALERSEEGTIVLYTDAAMHMIGDPKRLLACALVQPIVLFEHAVPPGAPPSHPQSHWTKRDTFVLLDADRPEFWAVQQLLAGVQIYRNCRASRDFVREVLAASADPRVLTDLPNTQGLENLPGFKDHRHDQSVLTIVAQRHGLARLCDPTQFGLGGTGAIPQVFHLHRKPDRGLFAKLRGRVWGVDSGNWEKGEVTLNLPS